MTVAIVGSGPSAIMCAWACAESGVPYYVLSPEPPRVSDFNAGVFYLHESPIPDIMCAGKRLYTWWIGADNEQQARTRYAQKIYGDPSVPVSLHSGWSDVWDPGRILPFLVDASDMKARWIGGSIRSVEELDDARSKYEAVFVTAPATVWGEKHTGQLSYQLAWTKVGKAPPDETYAMYNASLDAYWYRASAAFGRFVYETTYKPDEAEGYKVQSVKKVYGEPPALPFDGEGVWYMGRQACWNKQYLTHHAYHDARDVILGND